MTGTKKNQIFGKNGIVPPWSNCALKGVISKCSHFLLGHAIVYLRKVTN